MAVTIKNISTKNNILSGSTANLVVTKDMIRNFGAPEDFVEMHVYDPLGKRLYTIPDFKGYQIPGIFQPSTAYTIQELAFSPDVDLKNLGISYGDYKVQYNILRPKIVTSTSETFFIKEISPSRTEIRLINNNISSDLFQAGASDLITEIQSSRYFKEYYLNFGENQLVPFINVALDLGPSTLIVDPTTQNVISVYSNAPSLLIKLLNPLPVNYNVNDSLLIVDEISNPQVFEVSLTLDIIPVTYPTLRGPNFDLDLDNLRVGPTPYYNFKQVTTFSGSFAPQLQQLLGQLSASNFALNIDYTDYQYENFIHFSSAARRLEGFKYKLNNIELFTSASSSAASSPSSISQLDTATNQNKINQTIQSFDGWEQYMFYTSGAYAWPKQNSAKPYINYSVTASQAVNWYNGNYDSSSLYDDNNQNYLLYTLPGYITENTDNELAFKFVASIGQMFDDIWIHIKAITDLYQAKNSLTEGISKDLVYFALQSMGINVYTDEDGTEVFRYLYGVNPDGSYLPATSSYQTLVSASQYQLSGQDIQKGIYKRMYHSLPLLLKSKGTTRFIQYLNTVFGIPTTIMDYIEYGGVDKVTSSFEYEYDRYSYAIDVDSANRSEQITIPWVYTSQSLARTGFNDITPDGIEFRVKMWTTSSSYLIANYPTQSLVHQKTSGIPFGLNVIYTQTASADSIYSGSVGDFGYFSLDFNGLIATSSTIPIFTTGSNNDTSWYSVLLQRRYPNRRYTQATTDQQYYDLYVKNNVWGEVGHIASASLFVDGTVNPNSNIAWYFGPGDIELGLNNGIYPFTGSYQEFRLWSNYVSESTFDSHVLNPESIEGNYTSSAYTDLTARFPLGGNLYTYNHTVVTQVASTAPDQTIQSFTASFNNFGAISNNYFNFVERYYADVANSGYANPVTDKIRIYSGSEYGTQLLPNKSIEVPPLIPVTKDIHLLDAGLSPQDEINKDIIAQLGSTYDLDNMIGDPRGTGYNELEDLRVEYFKKYINKYNYKDYITLIEYFHNSLFRTLKDFTPARTNIATGIIIKNHLLERPVVEQPNILLNQHNNQSGTIDLLAITASNAMDITQPTYSYNINTNVGPVTLISDGRDFFTGELPSASINYYITQSNPFAIGFNSNNTSSYSSSIWNFTYNPLLNNVSQNQTSSKRQMLTLIGGNTGFVSGSVYVTESIQFQDFTDNYIRHANPRYDGSTTTSQLYNVFSTGDETFGKNAAIDKTTVQFAFFSEVVATGSDLLAMPERSNVYIKYLIDENSNLTELTKRNYEFLNEDQKYNLYQVQNIFKSGETINISLFDYQNPSSQINLDGNKTTFAGGYRYHPVLWRTGSEVLTYNLDANAYPLGTLPQTPYVANQFTAYMNSISSGNLYVISLYVVKNDGLPAVSNIRISGVANFQDLSTGIIFGVPYNVTMNAGATRSNTISVTGFYGPRGANVLTITNLGATNFTFAAYDLSPQLTVNQTDQTIISCSATQALYYLPSPGFTYSGSINGVATIADYPFQINPGDLIRLTTQSIFSPRDEYEIISVDYQPPSSLSNYLIFKVNRPVSPHSTASLGIIEKYVFSRKLPDETNIVIQHRKNPGETSAGIVKNNNLVQRVDDKLANIVSELKSKIFSTVLIP